MLKQKACQFAQGSTHKQKDQQQQQQKKGVFGSSHFRWCLYELIRFDLVVQVVRFFFAEMSAVSPGQWKGKDLCLW